MKKAHVLRIWPGGTKEWYRGIRIKHSESTMGEFDAFRRFRLDGPSLIQVQTNGPTLRSWKTE